MYTDNHLRRQWIASVFGGMTLGLAASQAEAAEGPAHALLKMIDRPRVPLAPAVNARESAGDLTEFHFTYAADAAERVPGLLVKSRSGTVKRPAVIVLHGTGGNKEGQRPFLKSLAAKGFVAVAIDGRYHGERCKSGTGSADYVAAMLRTYRTGREYPFLYDTVWDVMRLVDYLGTRSDVDASRIGMIGFSKGGMETYLAAAVDPRVTVAVPCIGVQSFRWALDHDAWHSRVGTFQAAVNAAAADAGGVKVDAAFVRQFYDRVAPGVYGAFDGPAMLPLIAPRPLLVINGDSDARTPGPGLQECVEAAKKAYERNGAADKFAFLLQPNTGHKVNPDALQRAVNWFEHWLAQSAGQLSS